MKAGPPFVVLDDRLEITTGHVSVSTMHLAKGLELRVVQVMACDDEVVPLRPPRGGATVRGRSASSLKPAA